MAERPPARRRVALLLGLLVAGCAHVPPTPESKEVDELTFEGMKALCAADLKKKLLTSESSCLPAWTPLVGHTGWFDEISWQADLRRIVRFYQVNGYYQARVLSEHVSDTTEGHVKVQVTLREGAPARLTSLGISGLDALEPELQRGVLEGLPLREGEPFLQAPWEQGKGQLLERLRERGFIEASVVGEAVVYADEARVEATLQLTPGTRYRFGDVVVTTDPDTVVPAELVRDVAAPALRPTRYASDRGLKKALERLQDLGVFAGVKVAFGAPDAQAQTVPVLIEVHEAPFHSVRAGFGLNGDLIRQEVHLIAEYTNRNLGLARLVSSGALLDNLSVKAKVGWAFLPTVVAVAANDPTARNGPIFKLTTQYEVPRLFGNRMLSSVTTLDLSRALDVAFDYYGGELKSGVLVRATRELSIFPSLNLDTYVVNAPANVRDHVPPAVLGCVVGEPCVVTFLDVSTEFDRRDNKLAPKEGYFLALDVQGGVSQTVSLKPFFKLTTEARGYVSFGGAHRVFTLAGKVRAGTLISTDDDTPIVVRFFSGGSSMRGFNQRRLSPQVAVPTPTTQAPLGDVNQGETFPIGGNGLLEGSLELRWNVWGELTLAIFNDWGLVTAQALGAATDLGRSLYAAVGIGARYRTPIGPIRLDFGVRLPFVGGPLDVQKQGVSTFSSSTGCFFWPAATQRAAAPAYGGSPEGLCAVHLSIGEAF